MSEPIIVELEDGRKLKFPPGTASEVVAKVAARDAPGQRYTVVGAAGPATPAATPAALPAGSAATGGGSSGSLADSFLARAGRGALINRFDPITEVVARGVAPFVGELGNVMVEGTQEMARDRREAQAASRARVGSTGMDGAGMAGTLAADALIFKGALGRSMPSVANPRSLFEIARAGGVTGAVSGALSPTEGSENMSTPGLLYEKGKQSAIGSGIGMLTAPALSLGVGKIGELAGTALEFGKRFVRNVRGGTAGQKIAENSRDLDLYLAKQAQEAGIDWTRMPERIRESLREATRRATSVTGELPAEAVRNRMLSESQQLPQLTLGQATRDPMQFSREANSPDEGLRALFGDQRNAATSRLKGLAEGFGPQRTPYELGDRIGSEIAGQAKTRRDGIQALYDAFKDDAAGYHKLKNTPDFVKAALAELKTQQQFNDLPKTFRDQLMNLEREGGKLSIRDAAQMWKNINSYYSTTNGTPVGAALGTLKKEAAKLLDEAKFDGTARGADSIARFQAANAERRLMGQWEESSSAIAELSKKNPRVAAEAIFGKYVMSGSVDDFSGLWKTLPAPVRQDVKRAFVDRVSDMAMNNFGSNATRAGDAANLLRKFPKEKLSQMFQPEELKSLRNTLEYLRLISEAPPGNFVNRSHSLVDLKDFLSQTQNIPVLGPNVSAPLRKMVAEHEAQVASSGFGLVSPPPPTPMPRAVQSLVRKLPLATPQTGPTLQGIFSPSGVAEDQP